VGWLWYLVSLVPVIGIVQVGLQSMADRYTYIPLIGLFIMIAWGVPDLLKNVLPRYGIPLTAASLISLILLAGVTWRQVGYWKNSVVLFTHAVAVTPRNVIAHNNLGTALAAQGRIDEAIGHFQDALAINPDYADAHYNLANQLSELHRMEEAIAHYRSAVQLKPDHPEAQNNLGIALAMTGQREESIARFSEAVRLKPEYMDAHYNLGVAFLEQGRIEEAAAQFTAVLHIQPGHADARRRLDYALSVLKGTMGR
jgi:tetratricopeptide (TPR) repeat protein